MSVYRGIRRMILSGHLKGGQVLSQVQLAQEFDTSRGPVREALRLLQREGLIEAETNQRARVVTFSSADLEQVCALLVLNVAVATRMGEGRFTSRDVAAVVGAIQRLEVLSDAPTLKGQAEIRPVQRRQLAFRRLITILCRYSGAQVVQLIDDLLDRVAMFRQLHQMMGVTPPYPLANRFPELLLAVEARDAVAMARIVIDKIADLSRKALKFTSDQHQPVLLDAYIEAARATLGHSGGASIAHETAVAADGDTMTIRVRVLPGSRLACEVSQG